MYGEGGRRGRGRRFRGGRQQARGEQRSFHQEPGYQKGCHAVSEPEKTARLHVMGALHSLGPSINGNASEAEVQALESLTAQQMLDTCRVITEELDSQPLAVVVQAFWDILLVKGHKAPYLACLLSLVNRTHVTAVETIVTDGARRLNEALQQRGGVEPGFGPSANHNGKAILRFYCALAALGVVSTTSLLSQLTAVVKSATQIAQDADGDVREWQPYTDFLVEAVILALPWGLRALQESSDLFTAFCSAVEEYHRIRGSDNTAELQPWRADPGTEGSTPQAREAFVITAWSALQDVLAQDTPLRAVPRPQGFVDNAFNTSAVYDVAEIQVPSQAPIAAGEHDRLGVLVSETYPPRGVLPLLPMHLERHPADSPTIDCLIMQEYYLHALHAYAANGTAVVDQITAAIATPFPCAALLVELLISQMLLPVPPLTVFGYQSMLVRLVEHYGQVLAMSFGGCMKTLFECSANMDPFLLHRCGELLAVFVSNNNYRWPWARWERVLEADGWSSQRRFCGTTLAKLVQLSADLSFIQDKVLPRDNPNWLTLLPASNQATRPPLDPNNPNVLAQPYGDIMAWVMEKVQAVAMQQRLKEHVQGKLGWSWEDTLQAFLHVLLIRGELAPQHTKTLLERYHDVLARCDEESDRQPEAQRPGASVLLDTVEQVWESNSQRLCLTVLRMIDEKLVLVSDVLVWLFSPVGNAHTPRLVDSKVLRAISAMELLLSVLDSSVSQTKANKGVVKNLLQSVPQHRAELAKVGEDMASAQRQSQDASTSQEERETLLTRLQTLITREAEAQERLQAEEQLLEASAAALATQHGQLHTAVRVALLQFIKAASTLQVSKPTENGIEAVSEPQAAHVEQVAADSKDEVREGSDEAASSLEQRGETEAHRNILHLLLQLMSAFVVKYVPAAHTSAEFLGGVLDEGSADTRVRDLIHGLHVT
jgi:hypothetical protein